MSDESIKDSSPYPSQSDMDMDMWRADRPSATGLRRVLQTGLDAPRVLVAIPLVTSTADRDAMARRIEGMGDLYEGLRRAAERMIEAGMDVSEEHRMLTEFVSPKPFAEGE